MKVFAPLPAETERLSKTVVDAAYNVHAALGPGLLESAYEACLVYELRKRRVSLQSQVAIPVVYDDL